MINSIKTRIIAIVPYLKIWVLMGCRSSIAHMQPIKYDRKPNAMVLQEGGTAGTDRSPKQLTVSPDQIRKGKEPIDRNKARAKAEQDIYIHLIDCIKDLFSLKHKPILFEECSSESAMKRFFESFGSKGYCEFIYGIDQKCLKSVSALWFHKEPQLIDKMQNQMRYGIALNEIAKVWYQLHLLYEKIVNLANSGNLLSKREDLLQEMKELSKIFEQFHTMSMSSSSKEAELSTTIINETDSGNAKNVKWNTSLDDSNYSSLPSSSSGIGSDHHYDSVPLDIKSNSCIDGIAQSTHCQQQKDSRPTFFRRCFERMTYPVMFKINTMQNNRLYFDFVKIYKEMAEKTNNDFDITIFHKIMQHKYDLLLALLEAGEKIPALLDIIPSESVSYTNYFGLLSLSSTNDYYEFDTIREDYYQRIVR